MNINININIDININININLRVMQVWSCHREIISDVGPVVKDWTTPACS